MPYANRAMRFYDKLALTYVLSIKKLRSTIIILAKKILFNDKPVYQKILINRDGAFGDSIVAIPALSIIRQHFPDSQIDLLSVCDEGVSFDDIGLQKNIINTLYVVAKKERRKTLAKLKQQQYDYFIQIPQNIGVYKSIRNMLLVRFHLGIPSADGWDHGRIKSFMRQQKLFLHIPTETQRFISMLTKAGINGETNYPLVAMQPGNKNINELLNSKSLIAFIIGGKIQPKKWPLDYWVNLAKLIGDKYFIIIVGGAKERKEAEHICAKTTNTSNLCDKLSIQELSFVLKRVKIAVSLDTGAMHLCDAVNTKSIVLFSTRDLTNKWYPNLSGSEVIEKILPCSFCLKTACENNLCMTTILPEEVYNKLQAVLSD